MSKINYDEVPGCYLHCIKADCKMADHCLRQLAMQNLPSNLTAVTILNPQLTQTAQLCSPSDIKQIEDALKAIGHEELKFDAYVEKQTWND